MLLHLQNKVIETNVNQLTKNLPKYSYFPVKFNLDDETLSIHKHSMVYISEHAGITVEDAAWTWF